MINKNFQVNKSVLNFIHARDFWQKGDAENYRLAVETVIHYEAMPYGKEIVNFNMIAPEDSMVFGSLLGDFVTLDEKKSGTFRKPWDNLIHFEGFESLSEWRLAVALEDNIFKVYNHISGAKNALDGYEFDYHNVDDWIVETTINLKQNDSIFYRPWIFHSFEEKLLFCHYIKGE